MEHSDEAHLIIEYLDRPKFKPFELFDVTKFTTLLDALQNINKEQHEAFVIDLVQHPLPESLLELLNDDINSIYNYGYCLEAGMRWFNLLDSVVSLGNELETLEDQLSDNYFNQELIVGENTIAWPHSANYLHIRYKAIKELHEAMIAEIDKYIDRLTSVQFPGISFIAQSHTQWQDSLDSVLKEKKSSIEKYQYLVQMKIRLLNVISDAQPKFKELDEFAAEFIPGTVMLPDSWYEITGSRIAKHSYHRPDLDALVIWLDRKILSLIPTFTIKQGEQHKTPSLAKEALKHEWRMLILKNDIEISVLDNFIDSNFKMVHQSDLVRLPYTFKITKERDLKQLIKEMRTILERFVVEESKTEKILWVFAHVSDALTYHSVSDYMKRN